MPLDLDLTVPGREVAQPLVAAHSTASRASGPAVFSLLTQRGAQRSGLSLFLRLLCVSVVSLSPAPAAFSAAQSTAPPPSRAKKKKSAASRSRRQLAPEPARIKEIQQALAREGFYHSEPTGKWDEETVAAMKNFQQSKGLAPTGKIEALSLQKLGLGSAIAGLAPPTPASPAPQRNPARKPQ